MSIWHRHLPALVRGRWVVGMAAVMLIVFATVATLAFRDSDSQQSTTVPTVSKSPSGRPAPSDPPKDHAAGPLGTPDRLVVPAISVDAEVVSVGTTKSNAQDVPKSLAVTGWWRDGQQPGAAGNAVIVGHTASKRNGVFDNLDDLEKGDEVTVRAGVFSRTFKVTSKDEVEVARFGTVADDIYRETGPSGLVLMTCGDWNGRKFTTTVIIHAETDTDD